MTMEYVLLGLVLFVVLVVLVMNAHDVAAAKRDRAMLLRRLDEIEQTPRDTKLIDDWFQRNDPHGYGRMRTR